MRPATAIPWCIVALLIAIGWIGACEQPFCARVTESTKFFVDKFFTHAPAIGTIVAMIALIVTIYFHNRNLKATQLSNSAKMVLDAFARFDTKDMRERRKAFARALAADRGAVQLTDESPVLDFFEDIAHLVHRGVLDEEMVWNSFGYWVIGYHRAATAAPDLIEKYRETSHREDHYREFQWLFTRIEAWRKRRERKDWSNDADMRFLNEESTLAIAAERAPPPTVHPLGIVSGSLSLDESG